MTGVNTLAIFGNPEILGKQSGKGAFRPNSKQLHSTTWQPSCPAKANILPNMSSIRYGLPVYQHPPPTPLYKLNIKQVSLGASGGLYQAAIFILKPLL